MSKPQLEIQPGELKFNVELKKRSICSIRLINNSIYYLAFKVKTTSPKKYSVKPNVGIVKPLSSCDFVVTMQAQRTAPPDMVCKDKFLIQSTIVPAGTTDENITPGMFDKKGGKYIVENKLRVILVNPTLTPVLSPINGILNQEPDSESYILKTQENLTAGNDGERKLWKDMAIKSQNDSESRPAKDRPLKLAHDTELKPGKYAKPKPTTELLEKTNNGDGQKLVQDIEEMKSKQSELESNLTMAEDRVLQLTEERRLSNQQKKILQEELVVLKRKRGTKRMYNGFPLLFVFMVALICLVVGYFLKH